MEIINQGDKNIIQIPTKLTGTIAKELSVFLHSGEILSYPKVTLDFSETEFIDSTSIGFMVALLRFFKENDKLLTIANVNDDLMELFEDTGLDMLFNIETDVGVDVANVDIFEDSVEIRLDISKEERKGVMIFHLGGVMNHPVGSRFFKKEFLLSLRENNNILVDFDELTFFDSLSVSMVVSMHRLIKKTGGKLKFCRLNYIVNDLFETLNIKSIIDIYETIDDALENW